MFANVLVFQLGMYQGFTYEIPSAEDLAPGDLVAVPFGRGNRMKKGLVLDISDDNSSEYAAKPVLGKFPRHYALSPERLALLIWIRKEYFSPFYEVARLFYPEYGFEAFSFSEKVTGTAYRENHPVRIHKNPLHFQLTIQEKPAPVKWQELEIKLKDDCQRPAKRAVKQQFIFDQMSEISEWISVEKLMELCQLSNVSVIKAMEKKGMLLLRGKSRFEAKKNAQIEAHPLTQLQDRVLSEIVKDNCKAPALLHGITGSGKTEIYFHFIDQFLAKNQSVLYLIPEIALTPQMIDRIQRRFPVPVAVLHSRLSVKERKAAWNHVRGNQASILLGTRSAIFAPVDKIGAIVVDECHDRSYHAQSSPRFHADEVAVKLGELHQIPVLLGSATPGFEQYHRAKNGRLRYFSLSERAQSASLPEVEVVDLREELKQGNRSMISFNLYQKMKANLEKGDQTILFLNRRGYSGFISCRACGEALKCTHCDVSLTYHHEDGSLRCHLCGRRFPRLRTCPNCGSTWLKPFSAGTQKLEAIVQRIFPEARIVRMDYDTTRSKESFQEIYQTVKSGSCDIVIGTQMVAKGWDFPSVTLIGVLAADLSLYASHYQAADHTFQLLDQVSGRAGRSDKKGHVVLQTYTPDHYAIQAVASHDWEWYYRNEEEMRKLLRFPPFGHLVTLFGVSRKPDQLEAGMKEARSLFENTLSEKSTAEIQIGETLPSRISRAEGWYRKEFMIQIPADRIQEFRDLYFEHIEQPLIGLRANGCQVSVLWNEEV